MQIKNLHFDVLSESEILFHVNSIEESREFSSILFKVLEPGMSIGLSGELGVGKTELVRLLLEKFSLASQVISPSFILEVEYLLPEVSQKIHNIRRFYHWDLYRLKKTNQHLPELEERLHDIEAITFVEWFEYVYNIRDLLSIEIMISFVVNKEAYGEEFAFEQQRQITCKFNNVEINRRLYNILGI